MIVDAHDHKLPRLLFASNARRLDVQPADIGREPMGGNYLKHGGKILRALSTQAACQVIERSAELFVPKTG
jgi:hypothetical protein